MNDYSSLSFLIVEDEAELRDILQFEIQKFQGAVALAKNISEAWTQLQAHRFDLVICDIRMPGGTGTDLIQQMKTHAELKNVPVIFLTGFSDTSEFEARKLGAAAFLSKPASATKLHRCIQSILSLGSLKEKQTCQGGQD